MKKKITALLLCLSMGAGMLTGCNWNDSYVPTGDGLVDVTQPTQASDAAVEEEGFTLAYYAGAGFNPYECTNINNRMLFSLIYQGLFAVDREYQVEPMLCKSYTISEDMMTHLFYLEPATFSDGTVLRSYDVVASLKAARESTYYSGRFTHIDEIQTAGDDVVRITTDCAMDNLPLLLDIPIIRDTQIGVSMPVGTGPYALRSTATGMVLQKREEWWCRARLPVTAQRIPLMKAENPAQIRDAFAFDNLGISTADPGGASYAEYRCDYELWEAESGIFLYLVCRTESGVFSDDQVRKALTFAIDRLQILEECYHGFGAAATLAASPNSPVYDNNLAKQIRYQPERLKQAVEAAGMTGRTVRILVNSEDSVRVQAARKLAKMIEASGLVPEVLEYSGEDYSYTLAKKNFELYLGQTKLSPNMDLSEFFRKKGELRHGGLEDEQLYAMCLEALENSGNFYNLHQMILQDGRLVPILFRTYSVYADRGLAQELEPSRDNVFWYSIGKDLEEVITVKPAEPEE